MLDKGRMAAVHKTIDVACAPPRIDRYCDVQRRADGAKALKGDVLEATELDPGDHGLAHRGRRGEIELPPAATDPDLAHDPTNASIDPCPAG